MRLNRFVSTTAVAALWLLLAMTAPAAAQATDTDTDGMPDAWETFFGLNPNDAADAAADPDGDGLTNLQEFTAGRHPLGRFARFFAEGSTGYFDTSLAVLNLSTTDTAHVSIALLDEAGDVTAHRIELAPRARQSVSLSTVVGSAGAVSIIVESDVAVAADRAMTWGPSGVGLSLDSGAPAPATTWYFAEGATGPFLLYYLFENPGTTPATVTVRYLREGDTPVVRTRTLPPHSRTTVFVNDEDPALAIASLGSVVTSDVPILAERAMYVLANGTLGGGSASSGSPALSTQWYFGEGSTGPFFHAFLSLLNPGTTAATATVTYHLSDGSTAAKAYGVAAGGRRTIYFNDEAGTDPGLAALAFGPVWFTVSSTEPILGERAMWWSDWPWYEGHAATGSTTSDVAWGVAEGRHGGPMNDQTYVLIGNTTGTAGQVRVSVIPDTGTVQTRDLAIAAGARLTVNVGDLFGLPESRFSVTVESLGAVPVPLAVDYARYRSVGLPFSGGGAAPAVPLLPADTAPSVTASSPAAGATGASSTSDLTVTFSEPVTAAAGAFTLACPSGSSIALTVVTPSPATTFTLDPAVPLPPLTACTLVVHAGAITDVDATDPPDVMTADAVISFTTAPESAPTVSATTPANGAVQAGPGANLTITFSEPVDVTGNWFQVVCGISGTRGVADAVVSGGPTTYTIDPNVDFADGDSCVVTVFAAQVADQDPIDPPDTMAANYVFAFTTDVAPTVVGSTPANGATQVATAANLTVTFSEPVTPGPTWFTIACTISGTRTVADAVVSGGPTTFTIDPNADFVPGEICTLGIAAGQVADQDAGDPPDTNTAGYLASFTIDVAPTVTATAPVNGSTAATTSGNLTVTFSEPVSVAGNWLQIVCATTGTRNVTDTVVTGGPVAYTIDPVVDFAAGEACTVTIAAASIADQDAGDPPDAMAADYVFGFTVDAQPAVTAVTPANGSTNLATSTNLTVTFSEPVTVTGNWFQVACTISGTRNPADTNVSGGPTVFTIDPNTDFAGGETCTVTIVAAQVGDQDAADPPDALAADVVFSFTTDSAPAVSSLTPTSGATVAANADLAVTFTEPVTLAGNWIQIACTVSGTRNTAGVAVAGGPTTFTIDPAVDFAPGESCTVTIFAAQVTDQDANDPPDTLAANVVSGFVVDAQPSVTATTPVNGAVQVASNASVTVTFSEPVTVSGSWFQIACDTSGTRTIANTLVSGGPSAFTLDPTVDFASGEACTVTIFAGQVADQDAVDPPDGLAANYVFAFTVDVAPSVTTTSPANGAMGVLPSATVTVNFSESVNATTSSFSLLCNLAPVAYTLSASPAASFTLTPTGGLPAGTVCVVTVNAAQVTDTDAGDPPDTMLADYVFTFTVPPDALDDARGATGNVSIDTTTTGFSVLANDVGPGITVTAFDATSARGGTVNVNAAGLFTYTPPVGYEGPDSFTYTITNAAGSDSATVTITVSNMVWFIDNTAAPCTTIAGGCGRRATPFSTLAAFEAVNGGITVNGGDVVDPEAGDAIFIATGAGTYAAPLTLEVGQRVITQGATAPLATLAGITFAPDSIGVPSTFGTRPLITSPGAGITLAANNQLHGVRFATAGTAINGAVHAGTLVMNGISITNTAGAGISLTGGGTVSATGSNSIQTTTGTALRVMNTTIAAAGLTFESISANGGANGIVLINTGGLGGLTVTGLGGPCTDANTSGCSGGTISNMAGANGATTGIGIYLENTRQPSFTRMLLNDHQNFAIRTFGADGFTLVDSVVRGLNGNDASGDEGSILFQDDAGTHTLTNVTVAGGFEDNLRVLYDGATARTAAYNVTGSTFRDLQGSGNAQVNLRSLTTASPASNVTWTFQGCTFENDANNNPLPPPETQYFSDGILVTFEGPFQHRLEVRNSTFRHLFQGLDIASNFSADVDYVLRGNTITFTEGVAAIAMGTGSSSTTLSRVTALIQDNTIGAVSTPDSGSRLGLGLVLDMRGEELAGVTIHNNAFHHTELNGIQVINQGAADGDLHLQISNNVVSTIDDDAGMGAGVVYGIEVTTNSPSAHDVFLRITNNDSFNINAHDIRVRQATAANTFVLEGFAGNGTVAAQVEAFLAAQNPASTANVRTGGSIVNYINGVVNAPPPEP